MAESPGRARPRVGGSWRLANVLLLVLALVLTGLVVVFWSRDAAGSTPDPEAVDLSAQYAEVTRAAREESLAFLNLDYRDLQSSTTAVLDGATGAFAAEYTRDRAGLVSSTRRSQAITRARVAAVGLDEVSRDRAVALVAANASITNRSLRGTGTARYYRLRLTLVRDGDAWLTSDLRFVG